MKKVRGFLKPHKNTEKYPIAISPPTNPQHISGDSTQFKPPLSGGDPDISPPVNVKRFPFPGLDPGSLAYISQKKYQTYSSLPPEKTAISAEKNPLVNELKENKLFQQQVVASGNRQIKPTPPPKPRNLNVVYPEPLFSKEQHRAGYTQTFLAAQPSQPVRAKEQEPFYKPNPYNR